MEVVVQVVVAGGCDEARIGDGGSVINGKRVADLELKEGGAHADARVGDAAMLAMGS